MSRLAIIGTIEAAPGQRDNVARLLKAHGARCVKDEPGTLQFQVLVPRDDASKVLLYEVYRDDAAFELHRDGASFAQWRKETAGMVVKVDVARCSLVD